MIARGDERRSNRRLKTGAYSAFLTNLDRVGSFLRLFDKPGGRKRGPGQPSDDEKELLRAIVVFSVGALDAYLHDLILEEVPRGGVRSGALADALKRIAKDDPSLALRVALADDGDARREEFREALDGWLSTQSFQGPDAVIRALKLIGKETTAASLDVKIRAKWTDDLTKWTKSRHGMVHRGGKPYVRRTDAVACRELIHKIADVVDSIALAPSTT